MKTIYYYQTFCGLEKLYPHVQYIDTIILYYISYFFLIQLPHF